MMRKRTIQILALIAISYALLEVFSLVVYYYSYGSAFSFSRISARRASVLASLEEKDTRLQNAGRSGVQDADLKRSILNLTLHPYLGFVYNPEQYPHDPLMTPYGLRAEADPLVASQDPHIAIVAITGGSVAERLFLASRQALHHYLDPLPVFRNKKVLLMMLGREAFQQPQQLFSASYYLLQGGRLDMLINLDGFNEERNGLVNHDRGVYPPYPFSDYWAALFIVATNSDKLKSIEDMALWKRSIYIAASVADTMKFSVTISTLWSLVDTYLNNRLAQMQQALLNSYSHLPYTIAGPNTMNAATPKQVAEFIAAFWERSSTMFYQLAQANHFYYFHFLQPNQYVENSKPLSKEEKHFAYVPSSDFYVNTILGYPRLQNHIPALRARGIDIEDLTGIYKNTPDTIYIDRCCHVNQLGNDIMAHAIGEHIRSYFTTGAGAAAGPARRPPISTPGY